MFYDLCYLVYCILTNAITAKKPIEINDAIKGADTLHSDLQAIVLDYGYGNS